MQNKKIAQKQGPNGPQQDILQLKQKRAATLADAGALFNPWDSRGTIYCVPHKETLVGEICRQQRPRGWLLLGGHL